MRLPSTGAVAAGLLLLAPGMAVAQGTAPVERLARFRPYVGLYQHADQTWIGEGAMRGPWRGTLEVGPAVKGWFVEWTINTVSGPLDRQLRMLMTWNEAAGEYQVWRFETLPGSAGAMGRVRFAGDSLIMEWADSPFPDGTTGTFRNTAWMDGPDTLVIRSEAVGGDGTVVLLGEWTNRRLL